MFFLLTVIFLVLILILLFIYLNWNANYWDKLGVPGPKSIFLFGNIPSKLTGRNCIAYEFDNLYKKYYENPFIGIYMMRQPQILAIQPEFVKEVLVKNFKYFHDNPHGDNLDKERDQILTRNTYLLQGSEWTEKRIEIFPGFASLRIKAMFPIIEDVSKRMIAYIKKQSEKKLTDGFDIKELASKYTTDIIGNCIFSLDSNSFNEEGDTIRQMGQELSQPSPKVNFYNNLRLLLPFIKYFWHVPFISKKSEKFLTDLMRKTIRCREEQINNRIDYMDYLIQLRDRRRLNELDMAAHTVTFFMDGFETTTILIGFVLYQLGKNRIAQYKLYKEIMNVLSRTDDSSEFTFEMINELIYLDHIIHETLRLYPPQFYITRKCTHPITLQTIKDHSVKIEIGTNVIVPIYSIHRNPEYYKEPEKFIPERFEPDNGGVKAFREKGIYFPFGDGPRICLGLRFAMVQVKTAVVDIIRNFEVLVNRKTKHPLTLDPKSLHLWPNGGIWIDLKSRAQ